MTCTQPRIYVNGTGWIDVCDVETLNISESSITAHANTPVSGDITLKQVSGLCNAYHSLGQAYWSAYVAWGRSDLCICDNNNNIPSVFAFTTLFFGEMTQAQYKDFAKTRESMNESTNFDVVSSPDSDIVYVFEK